MHPYNQLELTKDINTNEVQKWSAMACYAAKPKQPLCMISASGEQICLPPNQYYVDGASAILGNFKTAPSYSPASIESFAELSQSMEKCVDGSLSGKCATPTIKPKM